MTVPRRPKRGLSHVVAFDDAPFAPDHRGDVAVVGAVFAGTRLEGIVSTRARRDGVNSTRMLAAVVARSRFRPQLHAVLLQGIAVAGFNVVDIQRLSAELALPVVVVARRKPNLPAIRQALLGGVRGGARKWALIERAGQMEQTKSGLWVQRAGIGVEDADSLLDALTLRGRMPEPLRAAHLVAGGITVGESRGRS